MEGGNKGGRAVEEYESLVREIINCSRCPLHATRTNAVPGEGPLDADVMIVGEAPGRREDEMGRPFVGAAGKLLNKLIEYMGMKRDEVYITNVVKCRPPNNRDPNDSEIAACMDYLLRQIKLIKPKIIVAVGRIAGETLYRAAGLRWRGLKWARGRPVEANIAGVRTTIIATYHPAAALYNPEVRTDLEGDFKGPIKAVIRAKRGRGAKLTLDEFIK